MSVGIGISTPKANLHSFDDRRLNYDTTAINFFYEKTMSVSSADSTTGVGLIYVRPLGITVSTDDVETRGWFNVYTAGHTTNAGAGGTRNQNFYFDLSSNTLSSTTFGSATDSGTSPPSLSLTTVSTPNDRCELYIKSSVGGETYDGTVYVRVFCPTGGGTDIGNLTWEIGEL